MTTTVGAPGARQFSPSMQVAREIRAEIGRQQISVRQLSMRSGQSYEWWKRRITTGTVPMSLEDIEMIAAALGVPVVRLLSGWLPGGDAARTEVATTARYHGVAETLRGRELLQPGGRVVTPARRPGTVPITAPVPTAMVHRVTGNYSGSAHTVPVAA